jgi:hypothetical protein
MAAKKNGSVMGNQGGSAANRAAEQTLRQEQRENAEAFGERHSDNGLNEYFAGCAGIAADGFCGFEADEADAESGAEQAKCSGDIASDSSGSRGNLGEEVNHVGFFLLLLDPSCALEVRSRRKSV